MKSSLRFTNYLHTFFKLVNYFRKRHSVVVMMVMVKMVKIDFHLSKSATIINIIYLFIVSKMTESENENDQNDLDHFDHITQKFTKDALYISKIW